MTVLRQSSEIETVLLDFVKMKHQTRNHQKTDDTSLQSARPSLPVVTYRYYRSNLAVLHRTKARGDSRSRSRLSLSDINLSFKSETTVKQCSPVSSISKGLDGQSYKKPLKHTEGRTELHSLFHVIYKENQLFLFCTLNTVNSEICLLQEFLETITKINYAAP